MLTQSWKLAQNIYCPFLRIISLRWGCSLPVTICFPKLFYLSYLLLKAWAKFFHNQWATCKKKWGIELFSKHLWQPENKSPIENVLSVLTHEKVSFESVIKKALIHFILQGRYLFSFLNKSEELSWHIDTSKVLIYLTFLPEWSQRSEANK